MEACCKSIEPGSRYRGNYGHLDTKAILMKILNLALQACANYNMSYGVYYVRRDY